jgi:mannose-6-phosphate isomerase-like protein (cupin superfamily)
MPARQTGNTQSKMSLLVDSAECISIADLCVHHRATIVLQPDGSNPLHFHGTYTEQFIAQSGRLGLQLGGSLLYLSPAEEDQNDSSSQKSIKAEKSDGTTAIVPLHAHHRFFNPSSTEPITYKVILRPGKPSFERGIYVVYGLANDGLCYDDGTPKKFLHVCVLARLGDINVVIDSRRWGSTLLNWGIGVVLLVGGWWAAWTGEEDRLVAKYFGTRKLTETS